MTLQESLAAPAPLREQAQIVWDHYQSRRLKPSEGMASNPLEPTWVHVGYDLVRKVALGEAVDEDETNLVAEIVSSHSLKDGFTVAAFPGVPSSPQRVIHDGWKSGTPTWVFMGRSLEPDAVKYLGAKWVAVKRTLPPEYYKLIDASAAPPTLWIAYNLDEQMGMTALTANVVGPAVYYDDLIKAVEAEAGPLYSTQ